MITNNASGLWDNLAIWPAGTPSGGPAGTTPVTIAAATAVTTDPAQNSGLLTRTAGTTIAGTLTIAQSGTSGVESDLGAVAIAAGGVLSGGTADAQDGVLLVINGALSLSGTIAIWPGLDGAGGLQTNGLLTIVAGAQFVNYNAASFTVNASWIARDTPCTWSLRQYEDQPPAQFTLTFVQAWTEVAINANLGGIGLMTTDIAGNLWDTLQPPYALVYRNGTLWNGVIHVTRSGPGLYSFDLSFSDGIWQLGDHGEMRIFWDQTASDGVTPQWFCATYYWLVNRLNYETWQRVTTALPAAAPGTAGGLPVLDANALAPETPHTAANLDARVSAAATSSQVLAIATSVANLAAQISSITVAPDVSPATATYAGSLTTVRDQLTALLAQITLNPKPTYSAYGRKYSWTEYQALLTRQIEQITKLIAQASPYEIVSRG